MAMLSSRAERGICFLLFRNAVMVAVLSFNLLGDARRDWLDPRTHAQLEVAHLPLMRKWFCVR